MSSNLVRNFFCEDDNNTNNNNNDPAFVQAQQESLVLWNQQQEQQQQQEQLNHEESAALAAALAASEYEEQERKKRQRLVEQQQAIAQQQAQAESLELARRMQEEEETAAVHELAQALETSEQEAQAAQVEAAMTKCVEKQTEEFQKEHLVGSWDCRQCTFKNPPYHPRCYACQSEPPVHVLVFQSMPTNWKYGVELELFLPNGHHDGYSLEWIANALTKLGPPYVKYKGYSHVIMEDWKIVTDATIRGHSRHHDLALELVSPILQEFNQQQQQQSHDTTTTTTTHMSGLVQLRTIMEHIRQLGIATNRTCGFHVHVDATPDCGTPMKTLQGRKRLCQCYVALENAFDILASSSQTRRHRTADQNIYCRSNRLASFGRLSNQQRWERLEQVQSTNELIQIMNPNQDRYRKLNLTNLRTNNSNNNTNTNNSSRRPSTGTIEFRQHGGVEELIQAEAWVRLLLRFCEQVSNPQQQQQQGVEDVMETIRTLREEATPAEELQVLWKIIDCPGLEQFYTLQRQLFVSSTSTTTTNSTTTSLRNPWRCHQCRRAFDSSRALSQHIDATQHYHHHH